MCVPGLIFMRASLQKFKLHHVFRFCTIVFGKAYRYCSFNENAVYESCRNLPDFGSITRNFAIEVKCGLHRVDREAMARPQRRGFVL